MTEQDTTTETEVEDVVEETPTETEVEETPEEESDTFDRAYVEKLRKEAAEHRVKATRAECSSWAYCSALFAFTGRLADPSDLPFDESHLEDMSKLEAAIDELLHRKPHLASRRPKGDVGQGNLSSETASVDLAGILRSRA